jgi:hypothetical protein
MAKGRSPVSLADLIAAGLLRPNETLRLRVHGAATARVLPDGRLQTAEGIFTSPTTAAVRLEGSSTNGWQAWRAERGDAWVTLDSLRATALDRS